MSVAKIFYESLNKYKGKYITEKDLRNCMLSDLMNTQFSFEGGWYSPPEHGCAVLFGDVNDSRRINFDTLRNPNYWTSEKPLDWSDGYIYLYCSQVDRNTGEMSDFSAFHYLGKNDEVLDYINQCHKVHNRMISSIKPYMTSIDLYTLCLDILQNTNLYIAGHSSTDPTGLNFGHSLSSLTRERIEGSNILANKDILNLSNSRSFINRTDLWALNSVRCFTVEPRLRSKINSNLPQVSLHSIVSVMENKVQYQNDFKGILPF